MYSTCASELHNVIGGVCIDQKLAKLILFAEQRLLRSRDDRMTLLHPLLKFAKHVQAL